MPGKKNERMEKNAEADWIKFSSPNHVSNDPISQSSIFTEPQHLNEQTNEQINQLRSESVFKCG